MELENALTFLEKVDALKDTYRQCLIISGAREENTAEHSYSLAMAVMALSSFSNQKIDVYKTIKMALFHDIVEVYAGDKFHYHKSDNENLREVETQALNKVLAPILDSALADEIIDFWNEFEDGKSAEAVFLRGIDRFLPMYHNYKTKGYSWMKHNVTKEMALSKNAHIEDSSKALWDFTKMMLDDSKEKGWIN